jgi:hypothetical protein
MPAANLLRAAKGPVAVVVGALFVLSAACDKPQSNAGEPATSAAASLQPAAPASAASAPASAHSKSKPPPDAAGEWTGTYEARHYLIEMSKKEGAVREWEADKGEAHSGKGELSVKIADDGSVSGSSTGPLGELTVTGEFDGQQLRLRLSPVNPEKQPTFYGTLLAERQGEVFKGRMQASSGDSLTVRDAPAKLRRKGASEAK